MAYLANEKSALLITFSDNVIKLLQPPDGLPFESNNSVVYSDYCIRGVVVVVVVAVVLGVIVLLVFLILVLRMSPLLMRF